MRNYEKLQDVFNKCKNDEKNKSYLNTLEHELVKAAGYDEYSETGLDLIMTIYNFSLDISNEKIQKTILGYLRKGYDASDINSISHYKFILSNINSIITAEESLKLSISDSNYSSVISSIIEWLSEEQDFSKAKRLLNVLESSQKHRENSIKAQKEYVTELVKIIPFDTKFFGLRQKSNWKNMSHNDCVRINRKHEKFMNEKI